MIHKTGKTTMGTRRLLVFLIALAMIMQPMFVTFNSYVYAEDETTASEAAVTEEQVNEDVQVDEDVQEPPAAESIQEQPSEEPEAVQEDVTADGRADREEAAASEKNDVDNGQDSGAAVKEDGTDDPAEENDEVMPAQNFKDSVNGVTVKVSAPEGALPEGTEMTATAIDTKWASGIAEKAINGDVAKVRGANITFYNGGKEIEPAKAVSVSMKAPDLDAEAAKTVVHISDNGKANEIDATVSSNGTAKFSSDDFSVYIVVEEEIPSPDINAVATYEFYVGDELKNTQHIKSGDTLADPGDLAGDGAYEVFKGWYVDGDYVGEEDGKKVKFGKRDEVPKTETIRVVAKVTKTYYVTFLGEKADPDDPDSRGIVAVKTVEVEGDEPGSVKISDVNVIPKLDTSAFKGWAESDDGAVITDDTIEVTDNMKLYSVIEEANWIHFYENVAEDSDSDATYTGPVSVGKNEAREDRKPADPKRKGYVFDGWYTGEPATPGDDPTGEEFDWTETGLDKDTDLYAKWIPGESKYTVVIWKQKVSDSKDAEDADKTYDYETSDVIDSTTGASLEDVDFSEYEDYSYTGFHFLKTVLPDPAEVTANGETVVNVYYDRNLMTIQFYTSNSGEMEYVETTEETGTQYGKINDDYVQLTKVGDSWVYYTTETYTGNDFYHQVNGNTGTQYGVVNGQLVQLERRTQYGRVYWYYNNVRYYGDRYQTGEATGIFATTYALIDGALVPLNYDWLDDRYTYQKENPYTGTRYKLQATPDRVMTGLYGQTLAQNGETWPSEPGYGWYERATGDQNNTRLTFLDAFKFEGLSGTSEHGTVLTQYRRPFSGNNQIRFYKEDLNGGYPDAPANTVYSANNSNFTVTEKYEGFTASQYRNGTGNWRSVEAGDTLSATNLQIRFERNNYKLEFTNEGDLLDDLTKTVPYEQELSGYKPDDPEKDHYDFAGWFEDISLQQEVAWDSTMPAANKMLYAKFTPKDYHVSLEPNGGEFRNAQVGEFNVTYGSENDTLNKDSLFQNVVKDGYELVGWFYRNDDGTAGSVYEFGKIESDVNLIAKWRNPGQVSIVYDAGEGGSGVPEDNYKYATDSAVVLGAPPTTINEGYSFVGWEVGGTVYYVNNTFDITEDIIEDFDPETKVGTVTATAVYNKDGEGTFQKTHINWYKNDGSEAFRKDGEDGKLLVNEPVTIPEPVESGGRTFLGWARVVEKTDAEGKPIEPDLEQDLDENDLFIFYNENDGKYYSDADFTEEAKEVAGDEDGVYHAMFAVWDSKLVKTADITYDLNGGTYNGSTEDIVETHDVGDVIKIHAAPTREGYTFVEWRGSSYQPGDEYTVEEDHTFTAVWKKVPADDPDDPDNPVNPDNPDDPDTPDNPSDEPDNSDTPATGDDSMMIHWIILMIASAGAMTALWARRREEQ